MKPSLVKSKLHKSFLKKHLFSAFLEIGNRRATVNCRFYNLSLVISPSTCEQNLKILVIISPL